MDKLHQQLAPLRQQIDEIDLQLIALLNKRATLAKQGGVIKEQYGVAPFQPEREQQVLKNLQKINPGPLPNPSVTTIWREIMSACRALEATTTVAYLGPPGTFSEAAATHYFGQTIARLPCTTIDEVFRAVETKKATYGVVPVENSSEGAVSRTLDLLLQTPLCISAELSIPIHHNLLSKNSTVDQINVIRAHPQALAQCQNWLNTHYPHIERQAVSSTAEAARLASSEPQSAAIASEAAAQQYALHTLHTHIQDDPNNRTRFFVLGSTQTQPSGNDQTSLILSVPNKAGAICQLLAPLANHGVSMCRIESRPARIGTWEYYFYVDLEGHQTEPVIAQALQILQQQATFYKFLGSYSRNI